MYSIDVTIGGQLAAVVETAALIPQLAELNAMGKHQNQVLKINRRKDEPVKWRLLQLG